MYVYWELFVTKKKIIHNYYGEFALKIAVNIIIGLYEEILH